MKRFLQVMLMAVALMATPAMAAEGPVCGPEGMSRAEAVEVLKEKNLRSVAYENKDFEALMAAIVVNLGMPPFETDFILVVLFDGEDHVNMAFFNKGCIVHILPMGRDMYDALERLALGIKA